MTLAVRLKDRRKKLGLSQSALAKAAGVSQPTVANWERGGHVPRPDALRRMADALDTDPAWLLSGELPAALNPAHQHLAKPIHQIPVYDWPADGRDPTQAQPARYVAAAMDADGVFALIARDGDAFPGGTVLVFSRVDARPHGRFLRKAGGRYRLEAADDRSAVDDVFARLIYSLVPH